MQIILTMVLYNYKVPVIIKKNFTFCAGKSRENLKNIFPALSRTNKQNSRTFQESKKNPGLFEDVATLEYDINPVFNHQNLAGQY